MLVVIFGVSCVGKSTIIEQLVKEGCKSIRVFTTRELRGGENTKIHLSDEMFELYISKRASISVLMVRSKNGQMKELGCSKYQLYPSIDECISRWKK